MLPRCREWHNSHQLKIFTDCRSAECCSTQESPSYYVYCSTLLLDGYSRPVSVWYSVSGLTAADSILRVIPFRSVDSLHPAGIDRLLMGLNGRDAAVCGRLRKLSSRREAVGEQALHSTTTTISWRRRRITATNAPPTTPRGKKTHRFIF